MAEDQNYVKFSPEILRILQEKDIEIDSALRAQLNETGAVVNTRWGKDPTAVDSSDKEACLIILAAGITASLVGGAVSRIIDSAAHKQHASITVKYSRPALDGNGHPVLDVRGNPVMEWMEGPGDAPTRSTEKAEFKTKLFEVNLSSGVAASTNPPDKP